jgi:hypothetical protein
MSEDMFNRRPNRGFAGTARATCCGIGHQSACAAEVTALSRMKPNRRSIAIWEL